MVLYFGGTLPIVPQFLSCKIGAIGIIMGCRSRDSCRNLFKELKILPLKSQYKFSLLLFVVNNKNHFMANLENHIVYLR
jgi:hypothetical protein